MTNEVKGGDQSARVVEVAISLLSVHSKQAELSPEMRDKDWAKFLAGIQNNGVLQPLSVTRGNRVIDGKNRLRAARQLGFESVRVVYEDIPEDEIASYITETKLSRDGLTKGQRAAIVINLYYEGEQAKAQARMLMGVETPSADMHEGDASERLAKKAGIGRRNMYYLLAVKRNRPDLFTKVFNGEYAIGRAHAEMKRDEAPTIEEAPKAEISKADVAAAIERESTLPQIDEAQPAHSDRNRLVAMRKKALSLSAEVLNESDTVQQAEAEVKQSAREQLMMLARSCIISLGQSSDDDEDADLFAVCLELLEKTNGGNRK